MLTARATYTNGHFRLGIPNKTQSSRPHVFFYPVDLDAVFSHDRPQKAAIKVDDTMMVEVSVLARSGSGIVAIFCIASLIIGASTGFHMLQPFIAAVAIIACVCFYVMGLIIRSNQKIPND
jgi:hypothetical protein